MRHSKRSWVYDFDCGVPQNVTGTLANAQGPFCNKYDDDTTIKNTKGNKGSTNENKQKGS